MADENLPTEEKVRRSVGRSFRRGVLFVVLLAGLMGWGSYRLPRQHLGRLYRRFCDRFGQDGVCVE